MGVKLELLVAILIVKVILITQKNEKNLDELGQPTLINCLITINVNEVPLNKKPQDVT